MYYTSWQNGYINLVVFQNFWFNPIIAWYQIYINLSYELYTSDILMQIGTVWAVTVSELSILKLSIYPCALHHFSNT